MFGISFSELLLVSLVALLVLGPERLPGAARTAGLWIGRLKRSFNSIRQEVEREIGADEIRRQLHNEHIVSLEQEARRILDPKGPGSTPPAASRAGEQGVPPSMPLATPTVERPADTAPSAGSPPEPTSTPQTPKAP
ncbi:Sec-independent protein translocase subunit TatB [Pseudomonas entomophila]|jgi:sec-independent protein translocase protein TatB|uniref:Sec-independent protein translocase protein TatB n=1 Tax=Pseudomonas entomophila TaxID=312306 RepID=UPI0015E38F86|nr:Sec-independent protein translocase protein TatB [Pseudomonas entomophila]MBA1193763.1 Sec-independent protein translocase subunit TatB [Pseudomonas entomophila]